jgi:hypothetical protein
LTPSSRGAKRRGDPVFPLPRAIPEGLPFLVRSRRRKRWIAAPTLAMTPIALECRF